MENTKSNITNNQSTIYNKKEVYKEGSSYEGEMKDRLRQGQGTYYWKNKDKYIDTWTKGVMHGSGFITYSDRRKEFVFCENRQYVSRRKIGKW